MTIYLYIDCVHDIDAMTENCKELEVSEEKCEVVINGEKYTLPELKQIILN